MVKVVVILVLDLRLKALCTLHLINPTDEYSWEGLYCAAPLVSPGILRLVP